MTRLHKLLPGDRTRTAVSERRSEPTPGTVTADTATSISVHVDGLLRPKQFFFSRKRHWFSGRGHVVSIDCVPSETARNLVTKTAGLQPVSFSGIYRNTFL
jgi:hypothetical protein